MPLFADRRTPPPRAPRRPTDAAPVEPAARPREREERAHTHAQRARGKRITSLLLTSPRGIAAEENKDINTNPDVRRHVMGYPDTTGLAGSLPPRFACRARSRSPLLRGRRRRRRQRTFLFFVLISLSLSLSLLCLALSLRPVSAGRGRRNEKQQGVFEKHDRYNNIIARESVRTIFFCTIMSSQQSSLHARRKLSHNVSLQLYYYHRNNTRVDVSRICAIFDR